MIPRMRKIVPAGQHYRGWPAADTLSPINNI
jgi:hypothetical protein